LLPKSIIYRQKMGFPTPWAYWLAGPQLDSLERLLLEPRTIERGLLRAEAVKKIFAQHRAQARDHGNRIWRLLNLETWLRVMVDGEPAEAVAASGNRSHAVAVS
jgi:asparagine synthase (glutamine-hydrolysing)